MEKINKYEVMRLAIVIPYYKIEFLDTTLFSLSCQTDKRFTVYIGNNNSPEDPAGIIEKYRTNLNIVYRIFENDRDPNTLSEQFIQCVSMLVDEDWFMILGDDDFLEENVVADFYVNLPQIIKKGINVIKFSTVVVNQYDEILSHIYSFQSIEQAEKLLIQKQTNHTRSSLSEHVFKTELFQKYKIPKYPLAWCSDDMMILQYSEQKGIYCINSAVVFIRMSGRNISGMDCKYLDEKKHAMINFYSDLLFYFHGKFKIETLKLVFVRLLGILLKEYDNSQLHWALSLGRITFGTNKVNRILLQTKYPKTINIKTKKVVSDKKNSFYINTFFFCKGMSKLCDPFEYREEFHVKKLLINNDFDMCIDSRKLDTILRDCINAEDDFIVIAFEGHNFSHEYSDINLLKIIYLAYYHEADVLFGGGCCIDFMCKIQDNLYWVNNVEQSAFIILFKKFIPKLLEYNRDNNKEINLAKTLSCLTPNKMVIYPFISISI